VVDGRSAGGGLPVIDLPLVFVAGLLGSAHCLGMCGPFALSVAGGAVGLSAGLIRQLAYTLGRVSTYAFLGAIAGRLGSAAADRMSPWIDTLAWLAIAAGAVLSVQGCHSAGWLPRRFPQRASTLGCLAAGPFAGLLRGGVAGVFVAGLGTGLLPCGLVYGLLALAASRGSAGGGLLTMTVFGLGTAPLMMATGLAGSLLSLGRRQSLLRFAAICLVFSGILAMARGVYTLARAPSGSVCAACSAAAD
jgi:sulfite exporter TauE/SafE